MKTVMILLAGFLILLLPGDSLSRGPHGGGGGARPAPARTPSFSGARPSAPAPRPSAPVTRPATPAVRPSTANVARPSVVPHNRPTTLPATGNRPNIGNGGRPVTLPANGGNRPNIGTGNRPNIDAGNRPNIGIGNRPNIDAGNRTNIGINNRPININNEHRTNIANRPLNRSNYNYYRGYHNSWYHGNWNYWNRYPIGWFAGGAALGWLLAPGETYVYSNPYYVAPQTIVLPALDYSQPLAPPPPIPEEVPGQTEPALPQANSEALQLFDAARDAFKAGDYRNALDLDDKAITQLPADATLHEFRSLVLFAMRNYKESAATIYAVLAAGPGWDSDTLRALYPEIKTYTEQLRALEDYRRQNPKVPEAAFLLAYHYLTLGYPDSAIKQLEAVVRLQPQDQLAAQLLKALNKQAADRPAPQP